MSTGIGLRIRDRRKELGLSQEELANRLGLKSKSTVCKIERGDDNLTSDTVTKYALALRTTPAYLMGWEEKDTNDVDRALKAYEMYMNATPEVQSAVDLLLKTAQQKI